MIGKATHVPIVVRDQDKALEFYTEVIGFEKRQDYQQPGRPRWLTVAPKGQEVELVLVKGDYVVDPRPPRMADSVGNHWIVLTDSASKDVEKMNGRGVAGKLTSEM